MNINLLYFIRLLSRHILLLVVIPVLLVVLVFFLTANQPKNYTTSTKIYTGIASGSSIESLDNQRFDFFATNTAFDNMINIINARNTIETVGLKLFVQHLMLHKADPKYISKEKYDLFMLLVPEDVKQLVVEGDPEKTYENLLTLKQTGSDNFIYKLINLEHPDYSASKIQKKIVVRRISNSDLLEIKYSSEDPGICQNTLILLTDVFVKLNSAIKVNQSDAVVKYFLAQLDLASQRLKEAEDELLQFNMENNIINYYEQTKHIASQKEFFEEEYQKTQMTYHGAPAVISMLESKMNSRQRLQLASTDIIETRNKIAELNFKIAMKQLVPVKDTTYNSKPDGELAKLQIDRDNLTTSLRRSIDSLYLIESTPDGLVTKNILDDWLNNVMEYEASKAQLKMLDIKREEFKALYTQFAPLGATMMRLERKIHVAEEEYLSLLHSLSLAKLKQQNIELTSNVKTVDEPNFPITAEASKRKFLLIIAGLMGFILVTFTILILEFLDGNLRSAKRTAEKTGLEVASIFPKILSKRKVVDLSLLEQKATDTIARNVIFSTPKEQIDNKMPSVNFLISTQQNEGKSFITSRLCTKLIDLGYEVLYINHGQETSETKNGFNYLTYRSDQRFYRVSELFQLHPKLTTDYIQQFDFIFVEIPSIIMHSFPVNLFKNADHIYLVCRANRAWDDADINALKAFREIVPNRVPQVLLNGVEVVEMETVIGDLPRKRSWLRRIVKKLIRLRFFSKNEIV